MLVRGTGRQQLPSVSQPHLFCALMLLDWILSLHLCLAEVSSRNPHHSVRVQKATPRSRVPCISSCIESAATNLTTGSPLGIAQVIGYSESAKSMSPRSLRGSRASSCNGAMSPCSCLRAGSTSANCSGLEIPNRIAARMYEGGSPEIVNHGLS